MNPTSFNFLAKTTSNKLSTHFFSQFLSFLLVVFIMAASDPCKEAMIREIRVNFTRLL